MKIVLFSALLCISILSNSQKIERWEGNFNNGLSIPATVSYSFFKDPISKDEIKQGTFRYSAKYKDESTRFTHNFTGNYSNGFKNGYWEYNINIKDFKRSSETFYQSSEIQLKAQYVNGVPDGEWSFKAIISKRLKVKKGNEEKWGESTLLKNISVNLKFDKGKLIDSLKIIDELGNDIIYIMNSESFLDGKCGSAKHLEELKWKNFNSGFEKNSGVGDSIISKNIEYQYFIDSKNKKIKNIVFDTISCYDNPNFEIIEVLNSTIFNDDYFLYSYIDGDKMIKKNASGLGFNIDYKGMYYLKLRIFLNPKEENNVKQINNMKFEISTKLSQKESQLKKAKDKTELQKQVNTLKSLLQKAELYSCVATAIKNNISLDIAMDISEKSCGNVGIPTKGLSREVYLQKLYVVANENYTLSKQISY